MPNKPQPQAKHSWIPSWVSGKGTASNSIKANEIGECLACTEEFPLKRLVILTCPEQHKYCGDCFEQLVHNGCRNESAFPPRCCQVSIPRGLIRSNASRSTRKTFDNLSEVIKISPEHRWYCPHPKCYKTIDVKNVKISAKGMKCPHCRRFICVSCKQQAHIDQLKCDDKAFKEAMRTSQRNGWKTCYRCGEMVELRTGCRHITCRCGAQFCYVCSRKWDTCADPPTCVQTLERIRLQNSRNPEEQDEGRPNAVNQGARPGPLQEFDNIGNAPQFTEPDQNELIEALEQSTREYNESVQRRRARTLREEQEMARVVVESRREFRRAQKLARMAELAELKLLAAAVVESPEDWALQGRLNGEISQEQRNGARVALVEAKY